MYQGLKRRLILFGFAAICIFPPLTTAFAQSTSQYQYVFPKITNQANSALIVANLGKQPTQFQIIVFNSTGLNQQSVYIEGQPGIVARLTAADLAADGVSDFSGGVIIDSPNPLSVIETIGDSGGTFENVEPSASSSNLVIPFSQGQFGQSEISLFNADNTAAAVILAAISPTGATIGTAEQTLAPYGTLRNNLNNLIPGIYKPGVTNVDVAYVLVLTPTNIFSAAKQLSAVANVTNYASGAEGVATRTQPGVIRGIPLSSASASPTVPFFVSGGDYLTDLQLINTSSTVAASATLTARDPNGNLFPGTDPAVVQIPAQGAVRMNASNIFNFTGAMEMGSISVFAGEPVVATAGIGTEAELAFALDPAVSATNTNFAFLTNSLGRNYYEGFSLYNPNTTLANLTLTYILDNGTAISNTLVTLNAGTSLFETLDTMFPEATANGYIYIQSDQGIYAFVLQGSTDGTELTPVPALHSQPGFTPPPILTFLATGVITQNGAGLPGVGIQLAGPVSVSGVTDAAGTFTFSNLPAGIYTLQPQAAGYTFTPPSIAFTITNSNSRADNFAATLMQPSITSITPAGVVVGSLATTITITGGPFIPTSAVLFEGNLLPTVVGTPVVSGAGTSGTGSSGSGSGSGSGSSSGPSILPSVPQTTLTATISAQQLTVARSSSIQVINFGSGASVVSTPVAFVIGSPAPQISGASGLPAQVVAGNSGFTMKLTGSGFISGLAVLVNGQTVTSSFIDAADVSVSLPAQLLAVGGNLQVTAVNPAPTVGPSNIFVLPILFPIPGITAISPTSAPVSIQVNAPPLPITVTGFGFQQGASVLLAGVAIPTQFVSSTQLIGSAPASSINQGGSFPVNVMNPAPTLGASEALPIVLNNLPPVLTSVDYGPLTYDPSRPLDTYPANVAMFGSNFGPNTYVELFPPCTGSIGFATIPGQVVSTSEIVANFPIACAGTYVIRAHSPQPGGGVSVSMNVVVPATPPTNAPTITSLSPGSIVNNSGTFTLTITGSGFENGAFVSFNSAILVPTSVTATTITVTVPFFLIQSSGIIPVIVTNPDSTGSSNRVLFLVN